MRNKTLMCLLATAVLYGCSTTPRQSIPVVESGTSLTPGALRDRKAREAASASLQESGGIVAYAAPESTYVQPEAVPAPSAPIQADSWSAPVITQQLPAVEGDTASAAALARQGNAAAVQQIEAPVLALLSAAQNQQNGGDMEGAMASLERAQRIAPREPQVLYRMAELRLAQGDAQQAEQLAQQGLSLASGRPALQAGLWDLIAEAREKRGDSAGAAQARQKARVSL